MHPLAADPNPERREDAAGQSERRALWRGTEATSLLLYYSQA